MRKNSNVDTRTHSEERNWLISLGNGNLIEGVRILIERARINKARRKASKKE